jgi:RNA polymerase sigma-70 factor (ECF subfamily)
MSLGKPPKGNDEDIINHIQGSAASREQAITLLFQRHSALIGKIKKRYNLSEETALDAYTDSILRLSRLIEQAKFRGESSLFSLLYQITSNRCVDILRKESSKEVEWVDEMPVIPDTARTSLMRMIQHEDVEALGKLFDEAGERCRQVLMDSLYFGYKIDEIAKRNGLKNAQSASSIKSRCLSRLRKLIEQRNTDLT